MGNAAAYRQTAAPVNAEQDLRTFMQIDLPKFVLQNRLGNGKFIKSYVMRVDSTQLVVKVYMKPAEEDLTGSAMQLTYLWKTIPPSKYPSLMPYQMWLKSSVPPRNKTAPSPVYLIRQFFNANLYDRLSTRPFLNDVEKAWIIFQLFKCLEICHEHKIVHGDLKPENILCTTANWIVLTDFSPFKPAVVPDDDPTNFQYYFDPLNRHRCYVAPERFQKLGANGRPSTGSIQSADASVKVRGGSKPSIRPTDPSYDPMNALFSAISPASDVFSLGCVIAEILLDGNHLLDLPAMLQYVSSTHEGFGVTASTAVATATATPVEAIPLPPTSPGPPMPPKIDPLTPTATAVPATAVEDLNARQLVARIQNPLMRQVCG